MSINFSIEIASRHTKSNVKLLYRKIYKNKGDTRSIHKVTTCRFTVYTGIAVPNVNVSIQYSIEVASVLGSTRDTCI